MKRIDRRDFMGMLGWSVAGLMAGSAAWAQRKPLPNIVFILADDLGRHQLGCYGNDFYETPNIDRLAREGMKFTDAYAAAPVCSPTRASIMTGKYPGRLHITDYIPGNPFPFAKLKTPDWTKQLPVEEVTIPELLAEAGYVSGHFGKWHLGKDKEFVPGRPGDPDTQGFIDVIMTEKPDRDETAMAGADPDYDSHHARKITDRALAFMETCRDQPFFCYIGHNLVHTPEMAYAPDIVRYARKKEASNKMGNNPVLGAMVEVLDRETGRVLDALDRLGLAENTIVIFFSDNGDFFGREGLKPFYGSKGDIYEGGVRMPLLMRWPGVVSPGSESDALISSVDFFPTLAEAAGLRVNDPDVDGVSFLPALKGQNLDRDAIYWHYPHYHTLGIAPSGAIREGRYKLIEWFEKSIEGPETEGALELFDLETDPGERNNLAAAMPERTKDLYEKLRAWRKRVNAQEMARNPAYNPERAHITV